VNARLSALHARIDAMKSQQAAVSLDLTPGISTRQHLQRELGQQRMFHRQMAAVDIGYADALGDAANGQDFVEFTDGGRQRLSITGDATSARSLAHALDDLRSHSDLMTSVLVDLAHNNETNRAKLQQVQSMTRSVREAQAASLSARAAATRRVQSSANLTASISSMQSPAAVSVHLLHAPFLPPSLLQSSPFAGDASLQVIPRLLHALLEFLFICVR
jgi:hypothetical protein